MHLVIDIGNTRVKAAIFEQAELKKSYVCQNLTEFIESQEIEKYEIDHCLLVSVVDGLEDEINRLKKHFPVIEYTISTPIPLKNAYKSIATLGPDRLVSVVAGNNQYPSENILLIDFGTCIKYNFVNSKNEFIGGAISPGIKMRFKALNHFTSRLPLLEADAESEVSLVGATTNENILSGVVVGAVAEVNGIIQQYEETYSDLKVILTGGDVALFDKKIKKLHVVDTFLIMKGLNIILNYNLTLSLAK